MSVFPFVFDIKLAPVSATPFWLLAASWIVTPVPRNWLSATTSEHKSDLDGLQVSGHVGAHSEIKVGERRCSRVGHPSCTAINNGIDGSERHVLDCATRECGVRVRRSPALPSAVANVAEYLDKRVVAGLADLH